MIKLTYEKLADSLGSFTRKFLELEAKYQVENPPAGRPIDFREADKFSPQPGVLGIYICSEAHFRSLTNESVEKRTPVCLESSEGWGFNSLLILGRGEFHENLQIDEGRQQIHLKEGASLDDYLLAAGFLSRFPQWEATPLEKSEVAREFGIMPYSRRRFHIETILSGRKPSHGFEFLARCKLLQEILPELYAGKGVSQNRFHIYDVYEHSIYACDHVTEGDVMLRFAALLHDVGKVPTRNERDNGEATFYNHEIVSSKMVVPIMKRFGIPKELGLKIRFYVRNHMFHYTNEWSDRAIRRFLKKVSPVELENLIKLRQADRQGSGKKNPFPKGLEKLIDHIDEVIEREKELKVTDLAINGKILMEMGVPAGPLMGKILKTILEEVKNEEIANESEALARRAQKMVEESAVSR